MDLISVVILLGIAQGIFLGLLMIFLDSPNRKANRFLGCLFISFSFSISHFLFLRTGLYPKHPYLLHTGFPWLFLFGPLYYGFVRMLTNRTLTVRLRDALHLLPFVLIVAVDIPFYLSSNAEKLQHLPEEHNSIYLHNGLIIGVGQLVHLFAYLIAVIGILRTYGRSLRNTQSSVDAISLRWIWRGTLILSAIFAWVFVLIVLQMSGFDALSYYSTTVPLLATCGIYVLGYLGFRHPRILAPTEEVGKKYERSALTADKAKEYCERLLCHMESAKAYRDSDLTLTRLAEQLSVPPHQLSQLINESLNQNFFDFVNGFRVEDAKRQLIDPSRSAYTILAIAEEAGFNSKTSFNATFKRLTGMTPSAYRTHHQPAQ